MRAYEQLTQRFGRISAIDNALGILDWDHSVMMPEGAASGREDQSAVLRGLSHELMTAADMPELLAAARADQTGLDAWQSANLMEMRRVHAGAAALPADLVEAVSRANARCEMLWRGARAASDFSLVRDALGEVLTLQRRVGEAKGAASGLSAYDALLDAYDPGLTRASLDTLFAPLRCELPGLLGGALEAQARRPAPLPFGGPFPVETQRRIGAKILGALGFDFNRGRFDVSLHPFCGGAAGDVRITTRYDEADFRGSLMGLMHEGGHALYEQGRPAAWLGQPAGEARGMSMHESQSLLMEKFAGLSREFLGWLAPVVRDAFGASGPAWTGENLFADFARVRPGFIRVDADEVTYPAHVLARYALESAMISGDIAVADLPGAFNAQIKELLGLDVPDDRRGCLQDIHWHTGLWGYFPTYCVGAMTAAQFFDAIGRAEPGLPDALAHGDFSTLRRWLSANVHSRASSASAARIVEDATGSPLDPRRYLEHLRRRYIG